MSLVAGRVQLRPGQGLPAIASSRPLLAPRIARGRPARELPGTLAALFTLCAHAHRATAQRAVAAALGEPAPLNSTGLQLATAREHLLRIAQEWHRLLPGAAPAEPALRLRSCPAWRDDLTADEQLAELPRWLQHHWLDQPLESWLAAHHADPLGWAAHWCRTSNTPLARLLRSQCDALHAIATPARPLRILEAPTDTMPLLARRMADEPAFCAQPDWLGEPAETGPWTRINDRAPVPLHNAWMRFVARLVDLLHLAQPAGRERLAKGALALAPGEAIAWIEMARGLLVHWLRLEDAADGPRVADCRVLAPTEWNFHPRGVLAQALAALADGAQAARAAVAFDPCVEFDIESATEAAHA